VGLAWEEQCAGATDIATGDCGVYSTRSRILGTSTKEGVSEFWNTPNVIITAVIYVFVFVIKQYVI
jgi:hypothetical protein